MSRKSRSSAAAASSKEQEEDYVLVNDKAAQGSGEPDSPKYVLPPNTTPAELEAYEAALDTAHKAELLGVDIPPVVPPGHVLVPADMPTKSKAPTFWTLLFKRAENRGALFQLYYTTGLMVVIPLGLMALGYYVLFSSFDEDSRLTWSGFAGALGVNIVTIGFGLFAYYDKGGDDEDEEEVNAEAEAKEKQAKWEAWEKQMEEEETIENKERLKTIRDKHKQQKKEKDGSSNEESTTFTEESESLTKRTAAAVRSRKKDSAAVEEPQLEVTQSTRGTRSRSKKAD